MLLFLLYTAIDMRKTTKETLNLLWLIAMVIFTPAAGALLDFDVFEFRSVLLLLIWTEKQQQSRVM